MVMMNSRSVGRLIEFGIALSLSMIAACERQPDGKARSVEAWRTYVHEKGRFGFEFPAEWSVVEHATRPDVPHAVTVESIDGGAHVTIALLADNDWDESHLPNLFQPFAQMRVIDSARAIRSRNWVGMRGRFREEDGREWMPVALLRGGRILYLNFTSPFPGVEEWSITYERIVESARFNSVSLSR